MTRKQYQVRFARTAVGNTTPRQTLRPSLARLSTQHGRNFPAIGLDGDDYQIRELEHIGTIWTGCFARLREDAPHIVSASDVERELDLDEGDRVLDKVFFIYRERGDVLVMQMNQHIASTQRFARYLSEIVGAYVSLSIVIDEARLNELLDRGVYEVQFAYARPSVQPSQAPQWDQGAFDMIRSVDGAQGSFTLRAARGRSLGNQIRNVLRWLQDDVQVTRPKVRLTDEASAVDLLMAPVKDAIRVTLEGRYPSRRETIEEFSGSLCSPSKSDSTVVVPPHRRCFITT